MAQTLRMTATLEPRGPAGAFLLTDEQVATLGGGRKTFPVRVTINGTSLGLRLARMGGENMIGLSKSARGEAGAEIGSPYEVEIALDDGERTVEVPSDLADALAADPEVRRAFDALSFTHRKEFVRWVTEAKKEATRAERVSGTVDMVRQGRTR
jgi:Bacteriocin-protection, YdeI or OmpD-Associated/Domain of unknown function (DUF1905)